MACRVRRGPCVTVSPSPGARLRMSCVAGSQGERTRNRPCTASKPRLQKKVIMRGSRMFIVGGSAIAVAVTVGVVAGCDWQEGAAAPPGGVPVRGESSYLPTIEPPFDQVYAQLSREKPEVMRRQLALLHERYDLSNRPAPGVTMTRGKPVQGGVRVRLPPGVTWQQLAAMSPDEIKRRNLWPKGFLPLPHPDQVQGGQVFPKVLIDEILRQEGRDLTRFDVDFAQPARVLPEFPPPLFLTTRTDLGDVSHGELITRENFYRLFNGILTPKQIEGFRL